ncbi:MAG TPA: hypothetical protein ENH62_15280 [Marinobacter sp.]|uniref:Uncharacterized protein n=1 Tax=marine sediment metagenome TaxID=412755 RepID=A0A0F9U720_9ZZZZ|nr:hypothetical protein [Marinobacter sp.]
MDKKVYLVHGNDEYLLGLACDILEGRDTTAAGGPGFSFATAIAEIVNSFLDAPFEVTSAEFKIEVR